jgi:hypothetical protein
MTVLATVKIWRPSSFPFTMAMGTRVYSVFLDIWWREYVANRWVPALPPVPTCPVNEWSHTSRARWSIGTCCNPCCVKVACPGRTASLRAHVTHFLWAQFPHTQTPCGCLLSQRPVPAACRFLFSMWANVNTVNTTLANNTRTSGTVVTPENAGLEVITALWIVLLSWVWHRVVLPAACLTYFPSFSLDTGSSIETLVNVYQTTRRHISEDSTLTWSICAVPQFLYKNSGTVHETGHD